MEARQQFGYGSEVNFFDDPNCIAFMRTGDKKNKGCLSIFSNIGKPCKEIMSGEKYSNALFYDFLQQGQEEIVVDNNGKGIFKAKVLSVCIKKKFISDEPYFKNKFNQIKSGINE